MNLGDLKSRVWERLGEDSTQAKRYNATILRQFLNDGVQLMNARAGVNVATYSLVQRSNRLFYELPSDCVRVLSVRHDETGYLLDPTHWRQLDAAADQNRRQVEVVDIRRRWVLTEGIRSTHWFPFGVKHIALWPLVQGDDYAFFFDSEYGVIVDMVPSSGTITFDSEYGPIGDMTSTDTYTFDSEYGAITDIEAEIGEYTVTYLQDLGMTNMIGDTTEPTLPEEYHDSLVDYAVARCLMINARGDKLKTALAYYGKFNDAVERLKVHVNNLGAEWSITPEAIIR